MEPQHYELKYRDDQEAFLDIWRARIEGTRLRTFLTPVCDVRQERDGDLPIILVGDHDSIAVLTDADPAAATLLHKRKREGEKYTRDYSRYMLPGKTTEGTWQQQPDNPLVGEAFGTFACSEDLVISIVFGSRVLICSHGQDTMEFRIEWRWDYMRET